MNITGAIAGNLIFHYIKIVLCSTVFNTPFQITIVRLYRAAMFVLYVDTSIGRAIFAPRSLPIEPA